MRRTKGLQAPPSAPETRESPGAGLAMIEQMFESEVRVNPRSDKTVNREYPKTPTAADRHGRSAAADRAGSHKSRSRQVHPFDAQGGGGERPR